MTSQTLVSDLFRHQAWADAELASAIAADDKAAQDELLLQTLTHTVRVQQVFATLLAGREFDRSQMNRPPEDVATLQQLLLATRREQLPFIAASTPDDLDRRIEVPWRPQVSGSVADILLQVVLHSQNHRGQCLARLRELTGNAPTLDYIRWVVLGRPDAAD